MQGTTGRYGPLVDGWLLPEDPTAIFAAGKQNDVPILIGYTRDEGFDAFNQAMTLADVSRAGASAGASTCDESAAAVPGEHRCRSTPCRIGHRA